MEVYQDGFEILLYKLDLIEQQAISMYIGGLKSDIGLNVKMFNPKSSVDVYKLARLQEATKAAMARKYSPVSTTFKSNVVANKPHTSYEKPSSIQAGPSNSQPISNLYTTLRNKCHKETLMKEGPRIYVFIVINPIAHIGKNAQT